MEFVELAEEFFQSIVLILVVVAVSVPFVVKSYLKMAKLSKEVDSGLHDENQKTIAGLRRNSINFFLLGLIVFGANHLLIPSTSMIYVVGLFLGALCMFKAWSHFVIHQELWRPSFLPKKKNPNDKNH